MKRVKTSEVSLIKDQLWQSDLDSSVGDPFDGCFSQCFGIGGTVLARVELNDFTAIGKVSREGLSAERAVLNKADHLFDIASQ